MRFGQQTVGFVTVTLGDPDPNGVRPETRAQVNVEGCRFRPLRADEKTGLFDISTEIWKVTAPPHPAVLAAEAIDELVYDGTDTPVQTEEATYQLAGKSLPFDDPLRRAVFKITVLCKKEKS